MRKSPQGDFCNGLILSVSPLRVGAINTKNQQFESFLGWTLSYFRISSLLTSIILPYSFIQSVPIRFLLPIMVVMTGFW